MLYIPGNTIIAYTIDKNNTQDQNTPQPDTVPATLYSIVGGSSIAAILFLTIVIIIMASFLKKVHKSVLR